VKADVFDSLSSPRHQTVTDLADNYCFAGNLLIGRPPVARFRKLWKTQPVHASIPL
jgi:hypothetical protein